VVNEHAQWFQTQIVAVGALVPEAAKKAAIPDEKLMEKFDAVPEPLPLPDDDGCDEESNDNDSVVVTPKYLQEVFARFQQCRQLGHLPSLNSCFTLLETILMIGNKRSLNALLRKANLHMVLRAMQYNPRLNHVASSRPSHLHSLSKRLEALPLPKGVADLVDTVYILQYIKDVIVPVVCDDARFMHFTLHLNSLKANLCQAVFIDQRLLPRLFAELCEGQLSDGQKLDFLRFLQEFLQMATTSFPGEASVFWTTILREYKLIPHLSSLLAHSCPLLRRACIDIAQLLCDEDCRKVMFGLVAHQDDFLRRLFDVFCDYSVEEGTILQLQHTLPMLVVSPQQDVLTLFYDSAEAVLSRWLSSCENGGPLPPRIFVSVLMELLSLSIHHHCRTFGYHHSTCIARLIDLVATLWNQPQRLPSNVLVAINKGILSTLHLGNETLFHYMVTKEVFKGILFHFTESNNLLTSSILTLLHTIIQLKIGPLISYISWLWFQHPTGTASPRIRTSSFVQQLFLAQHTRTMAARQTM
jgi:hypothetical protein